MSLHKTTEARLIILDSRPTIWIIENSFDKLGFSTDIKTKFIDHELSTNSRLIMGYRPNFG